MDLRSNLSKARGLGSAHQGAHHWWMQRVTAVALVPLVIWFVITVIKATQIHGVSGVIYLLSSPVGAIGMIMFFIVAIYHGSLGIKVIIEDYVHCPCGSKILDISTKFIGFVTIIAVVFTIVIVHVRTYDNADKYKPHLWKSPAACHKKHSTFGAGAEPSTMAPSPQVETIIETPQE